MKPNGNYFPKTNIYTAEKSQGTYVPFVSKENINAQVFLGSEIKVSGVQGRGPVFCGWQLGMYTVYWYFFYVPVPI